MIRKLLYFLLLLLIILDSGYSFRQHYSQVLDGDMAETILPSPSIKKVLECPSGIDAVIVHPYHNPNRFFSHWIYHQYYRNFTPFLQKFTDPINSLYLSAAIFKTLIQLAIIITLAIMIAGTTNMLSMNFIIGAFIITPLFQTNGYRSYMGIIDPSITYTFFYAFPTLLLLIYLMPLIQHHYYGFQSKYGTLFSIIWILLAIVISLSGPLNPGIMLIFSGLVFLHYIIRNYKSFNFSTRFGIIEFFQKIPFDYYFFLGIVSIFSIYSLFIGTFNSTNVATHIPLKTLYSRLPEGLYYQFTQKLGFPILFLLLTLNLLLIHVKLNSIEGRKIIKIAGWMGLFAVIYIILLPLGGYRNYRPYLLRYDTIIPITISLFFLIGRSTLFLFNKLKKINLLVYSMIIIIVAIVFTNADESKFDLNQSEKEALKRIVESGDSIVLLDKCCTVLSWEPIKDPLKSKDNAVLLKLLGITEREKLYHCK